MVHAIRMMAVLAMLTVCGVTLGCKENAAATEKCKAAASKDECNDCCKKEGKSVHSYVAGSPCKCLEMK